MGLRALLDQLQPRFAKRGARARYRPVFELVERFFYSPATVTASAPHIRDTISVQRLTMYFVLATVPAWLIGLWALGHQANAVMSTLEVSAAPGWRGALLNALGFGYDPGSLLDCIGHTLVYFLPIFLVALVAGVFWESVFANARKRPADEGVLVTIWLYALILPVTTPLPKVVLGISFGLIVGKLILGGTGRYIVNPALLGLVFLFFAYPDLIFGHGAWIPVAGFDQPTAVEIAAKDGFDTIRHNGITWSQLFFGLRQGPVGVVSSFGCLIGALFLVCTGMASWRIIGGSVLGLVATVLLLQAGGGDEIPWFSVPWQWHLVLGGFVFGTVFLATDPVAAAMTNPGRWAFGILVGVLTIIVRLTNPAYNEGIVLAILLASTLAPLIDFVVVELNIRRRKLRMQGAINR